MRSNITPQGSETAAAAVWLQSPQYIICAGHPAADIEKACCKNCNTPYSYANSIEGSSYFATHHFLKHQHHPFTNQCCVWR